MEKTSLKKDDILKYLNCHSIADRLIKKDRAKRLIQLREEDSFREYNAICDMWEQLSRKEASDELEKQRMSFLVKRRELFNKVGSVKKNESTVKSHR